MVDAYHLFPIQIAAQSTDLAAAPDERQVGGDVDRVRPVPVGDLEFVLLVAYMSALAAFAAFRAGHAW